MKYVYILVMVALISNCTALKERFITKPEQPHNILAMSPEEQVRLADSYFVKGKYEKAIDAYKEFEKLHPTNNLVSYCIYQEGLSYYKQKVTIDRDQTCLQKAMIEFKRLKQKFPECGYISQANQYLAQCNTDLSEHEFYVAEYYFKTKHYPGAIARYQTLLKDYPDSTKRIEAQKKIEECQRLIANPPASRKFPLSLFDNKW